jgi:CRISPR-associated endoribonuclease Cas6
MTGNATLLASFQVARYRLEAVVEQPLHLPEYAGSALRGIFGHALRRAACVTGLPDCSRCALHRSCGYPAVFEPPAPLDYTRRILSDVPVPFVVEPPPWGEQAHPSGALLSFSTVLIGPALQQLPLVLLAWRHALQRGLGPQEGTARLERVFVEGESEPVLDGARGRLRPHGQLLALPGPETAPGQVRLVFHTPLRLLREGRLIAPERLAPSDLLMSLLRRTAHLVELQLGGTLGVDFAALKAHAGSITGEPALALRDWTRHSARQQRHMNLAGVVGHWTLHGDLAPFWPLLVLGQWLHAGKGASFGLGRYRIEEPSP